MPDSLLQDICACITDHAPANSHLLAANEGNAVALAAGYYLATGKVGLVYMQNSGLGNALNPLMSLTDPLVYSIPLVLLIGWRGEPGIKDEPQHAKQGQITKALLDTMGIKHEVLPANEKEAKRLIAEAVGHINRKGEPYALVVRKGTFEKYRPEKDNEYKFTLTRERVIEATLQSLSEEDVVVATTGKISREIYEYRANNNEGHHRDFLSVGSMGHASQLALAIAIKKLGRSIFCFDGDGAVIMHMGALAINGQASLSNFKHLVFNNGVHDSVGGQPTAGFKIDLGAVAKHCGYKTVLKTEEEAELLDLLPKLSTYPGPLFLEIFVKPGARNDLGRPKSTLLENKKGFMTFLNQK